MPDPTLLLRAISGETVFGLDVDSKIRQASNETSAMAFVHLFNRCDDSVPGWEKDFADSLMELSTGDPSCLIGFDDGRWQGLEEGDGEDWTEPVAESVHYLRLAFTNADAAYYQFHLFPDIDAPFLAGSARKREAEFQHLRIDLTDPAHLQEYIRRLRSNPHLVSVEESTEEIFNAAASHSV